VAATGTGQRGRAGSVAAMLGAALSKNYRERSNSVSSISSVASSATMASTASSSSAISVASIPWFTRNRRQASTTYVFYYITVFMVLYVGGMIAIQVVSQKMRAGMDAKPHPQIDCTRGWELFPMVAVTAFLLFIINPALLFAFRNVQDAFGIRFELAATWAIWTVCLLLDLLWTYVPNFPGFISEIWPHYNWFLVGFALTHVLAVIRPVVLYWNQRRDVLDDGASSSEDGNARDPEESRGFDKKSGVGSKRAFEIVLTDSVLFDEFKQFAVRDFSVENALFYERVSAYRNLPPPLPAANGTSVANTDHLAKEARKIYYLFLRDHADLQLNLSSRTVRDIESDIRLKRFDPSMFDRALSEVVQLMWTDTYGRFVRGCNKEWRRDLIRRANLLNNSGTMDGSLSKFMSSGSVNSSKTSVGSMARSTQPSPGKFAARRSLIPVPL